MGQIGTEPVAVDIISDLLTTLFFDSSRRMW
jgi:hypothetical protein